MSDNLRDRIAVTLWNFARPKALTIEEAPLPDVFLGMADAVIAELDSELMDFGMWLAEELGEPVTRTDMESCINDWKAAE